MVNKDYKCGNCGTIVEDKILSWSTGDVRNVCSTCEPLCKDCFDGGGLFSTSRCKGCENKTETESFRWGDWK
jgi:hypothetical protein